MINFNAIAVSTGIVAKKGTGYGIAGTGWGIEKTGWAIKEAGAFIERQGMALKNTGLDMVAGAAALGMVMKGEADFETCKKAGLSDEQIAAYFNVSEEQVAASEKPQTKAKDKGAVDPKNGLIGNAQEGEELSAAQAAELYA